MFFKKLELSDAPLVAGAVVDACRARGWSNALQPYFLRILFKNFLGLNIDFASLQPISSEVVKQAFDDHEKRVELIDFDLPLVFHLQSA